MTGSLRSNKGKFYSVLNLVDECGKRKQKSINLHIIDIPGNRRKAESAHRKVLVEYEKFNRSTYKKDVLFCDYIKEWLNDASRRIEQTTYESYVHMINKHIYPYFLNLKVSVQDLTHKHIKGYYDLKISHLSPNTLLKHHTIINQTLNRALMHDLISVNPVNKVTLFAKEKFKGGFLTVEQGRVLLNAAKDTPIETVVILGMMYGLRRSEIAGLKWSAIDFEQNTIAIQHTVVRVSTEIAKDRTKNLSSYRILPLNKDIKAHLLKLRSKQEEERLLLGKSYYETDYVCRWSDGRPMHVNYFSRSFKKLLAENGLPNIRLHDMRHSCASYMLKMGCTMKDVADWLGHSDIQTAMNVYAHKDMEDRRDTAERFVALLDLQFQQ